MSVKSIYINKHTGVLKTSNNQEMESFKKNRKTERNHEKNRIKFFRIDCRQNWKSHTHTCMHRLMQIFRYEKTIKKKRGEVSIST